MKLFFFQGRREPDLWTEATRRDRRVLTQGDAPMEIQLMPHSWGPAARAAVGPDLQSPERGERMKLPHCDRKMSFHDESPLSHCLSYLTVLSQRMLTSRGKMPEGGD